MALTAEESLSLLRTYYGGAILLTAGFSLQLYLCIQGVCSFYRLPSAMRRGRQLYIYVMLLTLFASAIVFSADMILKMGLVTAGATIAFGSPAPIWSNILYFFGVGIVHVAGDGLLAWRCYLLWREDNRLIGLAPLVPYISSIGMGITLMVTVVTLNPSVHGAHLFHTKIQGAWLFLSVGVNICATTLICIRLKHTNRELCNRLGRVVHNTPYTKVAIMLIESAAPFTVFGVAAAIASILFSTVQSLQFEAASAISILWPLWITSCALAPQLIIFRVATGASWVSSPTFLTGATSNRDSSPIFSTVPVIEAYFTQPSSICT